MNYLAQFIILDKMDQISFLAIIQTIQSFFEEW